MTLRLLLKVSVFLTLLWMLGQIVTGWGMVEVRAREHYVEAKLGTGRR